MHFFCLIFLQALLPLLEICGVRWSGRPAGLAAFYGLCLFGSVVISTITYHFIELPGIRLGDRLIGRLNSFRSMGIAK